MTLKNAWKAPLVVLLVSAAANIGTWLVVKYLFPQDHVAAILHYNTSVGIDFIGEGSQITSIPIIGTAILIGNTILALFLRGASRRAAAMFWAILPCIEIILLASILLILRLNQ